jgi:hypothetical protein
MIDVLSLISHLTENENKYNEMSHTDRHLRIYTAIPKEFSHLSFGSNTLCEKFASIPIKCFMESRGYDVHYG